MPQAPVPGLLTLDLWRVPVPALRFAHRGLWSLNRRRSGDGRSVASGREIAYGAAWPLKAISTGIGITLLALATPLLPAGWALLGGRAWGRWLGMIAAAIAGLAALFVIAVSAGLIIETSAADPSFTVVGAAAMIAHGYVLRRLWGTRISL